MTEGNEPVDFEVADRAPAYDFNTARLGAIRLFGAGQGGEGYGESVSGDDDGAVAGAAREGQPIMPRCRGR